MSNRASLILGPFLSFNIWKSRRERERGGEGERERGGEGGRGGGGGGRRRGKRWWGRKYFTCI